MHAAGLATMA
jgi:hypothetical protein